YTGFHNVTTSRKCVAPQLVMNDPNAHRIPAKGSFPFACLSNHTIAPAITRYDTPIVKSVTAKVHSSLRLPARQYWCGRKSLAKMLCENIQSTPAAQNVSTAIV